MSRHARRLRDESFHTPSTAVINPEIDTDDDDLDVAAYLAMSLPRVSDRYSPRFNEERV
ncbi:hypothetical protein [Agrobacterium tumefaciens]|uniref:hypothetical protein n=1 Tax=Agrobacterium tumefaciens TaxID=358 RepID=UPI001573350E|nr:hypothetical protein [Agrobacterium tumefaciens]NTD85475.1 hypothetical protein [Agrobacterium tumefaciens]NTD90824.1 hypothetical protein [Agrobacterium tumefaciens]NTD96380.1 hypothetical protein [Agrobacterium tumefaciens]NTE15898.1 hypothetical protein [Agrobacterium tumefaciens]NTE23114.1 hypothetical protein [Agrobacterium tumefaciens]